MLIPVLSIALSLTALDLDPGPAPGSVALEPAAARVDDGPSYVSELVAGQEALIASLEELAAWCKSNRLLREADTCFRQILLYDEEHEKARKALRYSKKKGAWVQSASYRQPRNFSKEALKKFETRRIEALSGYKQLVFDLNEKHKTSTPLEQRERALLGLLDLSPDDPEVRAALGEARVGDEWLLQESANTLRARQRIPELARSCVATAPEGSEDEPNGLEQLIGLNWTILETPYLRVAGTGSRDEVERVLAVTQGAGEFFRTLLKNDTLPRVGFAIYLLTASHEKKQFLDRHPRVRPEDRAYLERLESAGIPRTGQTAEFSATVPERLDRSTRQTIGGMLADTYGVTTKHGWAWEGLGIYMTYQLVGTRLTYYIRPDKYGGDPNATETQRQLMTRLFQPESDWVNEARLYFVESGQPPPKLAILMGRKVDSMSAADLLWSYVLASYLLEGWPDKAPAFLAAIGRGTRPHEAVRQVFEMELPRFQDRVERWLEETN